MECPERLTTPVRHACVQTIAESRTLAEYPPEHKLNLRWRRSPPSVAMLTALFMACLFRDRRVQAACDP
jgi:hypothetical protein